MNFRFCIRDRFQLKVKLVCVPRDFRNERRKIIADHANKQPPTAVWCCFRQTSDKQSSVTTRGAYPMMDLKARRVNKRWRCLVVAIVGKLPLASQQLHHVDRHLRSHFNLMLVFWMPIKIVRNKSRTLKRNSLSQQHAFRIQFAIKVQKAEFDLIRFLASVEKSQQLINSALSTHICRNRELHELTKRADRLVCSCFASH